MEIKQAVAELDGLIYQYSGLVHDERMAWETIRANVLESPTTAPNNAMDAIAALRDLVEACVRQHEVHGTSSTVVNAVARAKSVLQQHHG